MRILPALACALISALPALSHAYCFSLYTQSNQLVYRSTTPPVDLSQRIKTGLDARYPNHHLVFVPDETRCTEVGALATGVRYATGGDASESARDGGRARPRPPPRRRDRE